MGIGALMIGIGSTFLTTGFAATAIGGIVAGAIGGAIVGAAIGGLTSAIMGGDIGKGILFGAIGGAVSGGFAGYAANAGNTALAASQTTEVGAAQVAGNIPTTVHGGTISQNFIEPVRAASDTMTIAQKVGQVGIDLAKEYGDDLVKGVADAYMKGKAADKEFDQKMEMAKLTHEQNKELRSMTSGATGGMEAPEDKSIQLKEMDIAQRMREMNEQTRRYNVDREDRLKTEAQMKKVKDDRIKMFSRGASRGGDITGTGDKGVQELRQDKNLAEQGATALTKPEGEVEVTSTGTDGETTQTALAPKEEETR